jgi:vancomycin resistance protein YoaR
MSTLTEPIEGTTERRHTSARLRFTVAFLVGVLLTLALGAGVLYAYDQQYAGRVLPGVQVGGVDLSGLTPDDARAKLDSAYHGMSEGRVVLAVPDGTEVITYAEIGRRIESEALVAKAMAVGRDGSAIDRAVANARTALRGVAIGPSVTFDAARLSDRITSIADHLRIAPAEASVTVDEKLAFQVVPGNAGRTVDTTGVIEAVTVAVAALDAPAEVTATLPATTVEPVVTTAEATDAQAGAERMVANITLVVGKKTVPIDTMKLRPLISFAATGDGGYEPVVDATKVPALLDGVAKKIDQKAVNATFKTTGSKITGVVASKDGHALDVPATARQIEALLAARAIGTAATEIRPALTVTEPALTTAEAKAAAPKMKKIGPGWTTYFPIWERNGFGANIWLPALAIDGYVVGPREKFDFWKAVGPITRAKGYKQGGAIINGKTEPLGALAGGICSCSTTLFNAVLRAGYKMGARRNHFYYIDRYPLGLDATVAISGSSVTTMSWTNDTDYPVLIRGYKIRDGSRGYVRFELYSVPTGRKVTIGAPTVRNVRPASDSVQYTSSLAPGARKRIESPVDGKQVWRTVTVRDSKGTIIHKTTYYSNYARITGVVLVGRGETE